MQKVLNQKNSYSIKKVINQLFFMIHKGNEKERFIYSLRLKKLYVTKGFGLSLPVAMSSA